MSSTGIFWRRNARKPKKRERLTHIRIFEEAPGRVGPYEGGGSTMPVTALCGGDVGARVGARSISLRRPKRCP